MGKSHQVNIFKAMMHPGFYPHPVSIIEREETHISTVFLTGPMVYKIKKPVDLGFLDYTTLEKRRHFCRQEVSLNRRLSNDVYVDVVPITLCDGAYILEGPGAPVEFAVKMVQLAESDSMRVSMKQAALDESHIEKLVRLLVRFYGQTATNRNMAALNGFAWKDNLKRIESFAGRRINRRQFEYIQCAAQSFFERHKRLFQRRREAGKIRDCHGDLRTDHIYFTENGIQVIDCIEFNDRLRYVDIISDLAFLAMDLEYNHFPQTARSLIRMYVEQTEDVDALPLLDFYRCYRAMVRCKVSCCHMEVTGNLRSDHDTLQAAADRYLAMAQDYAAAFSQATLWMVCGLPASGKSTLAKALATVLDINLIRSDVIRKEAFAHLGDPSRASTFSAGQYSAYATEVTYRRLLALALEELKKGQSVVIDATFSRHVQRAQALRMAACRQARPIFLECRATEPILAARLLQRETQPSVSDARLIHLEAFKKRFEPLARISKAMHILIDTEKRLADCLQYVLLAGLL